MNSLGWLLLGELAIATPILALALMVAQRRRARGMLGALEKLLDNVAGDAEQRRFELRQGLEALHGMSDRDAERTSEALLAEEREFLRNLVTTLAHGDMAGLESLHRPLASLLDQQMALLAEARGTPPMPPEWMEPESEPPAHGETQSTRTMFDEEPRAFLPMEKDNPPTPEPPDATEALSAAWEETAEDFPEDTPERGLADREAATDASPEDSRETEEPEFEAAESGHPVSAETPAQSSPEPALAAWEEPMEDTSEAEEIRDEPDFEADGEPPGQLPDEFEEPPEPAKNPASEMASAAPPAPAPP